MMKYNLEEALLFLENTPSILSLQLSHLPQHWIAANEGPETWSAFDVVGHLLHGEKTDWISRLEIILSDSPDKTFKPFDRFAQLKDNQGKSIQNLLEEFKVKRQMNLAILRSKNINEKDFGRSGIHPALGQVTLRNLLSTWVAHDLNHMSQINRILANQYKTEIGPWSEFLRIINK